MTILTPKNNWHWESLVNMVFAEYMYIQCMRTFSNSLELSEHLWYIDTMGRIEREIVGHPWIVQVLYFQAIFFRHP